MWTVKIKYPSCCYVGGVSGNVYKVLERFLECGWMNFSRVGFSDAYHAGYGHYWTNSLKELSLQSAGCHISECFWFCKDKQ